MKFLTFFRKGLSKLRALFVTERPCLKKTVSAATVEVTCGPKKLRAEISECRRLAKHHGIKVYFKYLKCDVAGCAFCKEGIIYLNRNLRHRSTILSVYFHEYCHIWCYRNGKWKRYHENHDPKLYLSSAVKAERFVDRMAEHELFVYDARVKYVSGYKGMTSKEMREFLAEE